MMRPWRIGVVGSGPAGFYTAYKVLKNIKNCQLELMEAMPVPYGLVRFGVAPDHPEVKAVQNKFDVVAQDPRFQFIGNVRLGDTVSVDDLRARFDILVLAYGASKDRTLGIPGESTLNGIVSARDFVGWYNGQPAFKHLKPDLTRGKDAIVIGQGNVALDVARVLLSPVDALAKTDMTQYAIDTLRASKVRHVSLIGRRGPLQAAFSIKELREMLNLPGVTLKYDRDLLVREMNEHSAVLAKDRPKKRLLELLLNYKPPVEPTSRSWSLDFLASPVEFIASKLTPTQVDAVKLSVNTLQHDLLTRRTSAMSTKVHKTMDAPLILRSIGYKSVSVPGLPFDEIKGVVPNTQGRVLQSDHIDEQKIVPGLYVAGWLKRGPTGVIATTMYDAFQTADCIIADISTQDPPENSIVADREEFMKLLTARGQRPVTFQDWKRVEAEEKRRGALLGKPQEKLTSVQDILAVIDELNEKS